MQIDTADSLPNDIISEKGDGVYAGTCPTSLTGTESLNEILMYARSTTVADVHISSDKPLLMRRKGVLVAETEVPVRADHLEKILKEAIHKKFWDKFQECGDCECVHVFPGGGRYRMVLVKQRFGIELTARVIPSTILTFEESGMPKAAEELIKWKQGLVLVTGPAGSGKTSTLSMLVEMINTARDEHIITIEEPIEMLFESKLSQITQREIGSHTLSQENALRGALRSDPDIIVVSELRDLRTISLAVTAAETGHLVLGTMNTNCASQTILTLIDSFPAEEQGIITNMISESLRGVISQQLVPKKDGTGLVPAYELLLVIPSVASLIRTGNLHQINNAISMGKSSGMMLLDESLQALVSSGAIEGSEAYMRAINPKLFQQYASKGV